MAAGGSSRLGRPKQLLPYKDSTLLRHLTQQAVASDATHVRVLVGAERALLADHLHDLGVTIVENEHWTAGLSASIKAGLDTVPQSADGVILMLCDMPSVTTAHLNALIRTQQERSKGIVASRYQRTPGVPALFVRRYFGDLQNLRGDGGAKVVLLLRAEDVALVDLPGGEIDIDTEEDVTRYLLHPT